MNETLYYLCHMPDPSMKQTLCVMLDTDDKTTDWDDIATGKFFINGQHSVGASLKMQAMGLLDKIEKSFLKWNCFIVWLNDKN
jgi:hypothetical protein